MKKELSIEQKRVVDEEGYLLVKAPPGSGKTFTLVEKVKKTLDESNKKIIVLTFSNKAAEELKSRIESTNRVFVGTIHSFCQDLVLSRGHLIGLPDNLTILSDERDKMQVITEVINSSSYLSDILSDYRDNGDFQKILEFIKVKKNRLESPESVKAKQTKFSELYYEVYSAYNNRMLDLHLVDFDDLLYYAFMILDIDIVANIYAKTYGALFVDEAQDLNNLQYQLIKSIGKNIKNVMLIGDPDQSLYGFMGSSNRFMSDEFVKDFSPKEISLTENFRSSKEIVELTNLLKNRRENLSNYPIEGIISYNKHENEEVEAKYIVDEIVKLYPEKDFSGVSVLGRNRYLFEYIISELESRNIPYNRGRESKVYFETNEIKLLLVLLRIHANPNNVLLEDKKDELVKEIMSNPNIMLLTIEKIESIASVANLRLSLFHRELETLRAELIEKEDDNAFLLVQDVGMLSKHWEQYNRNHDINSKSVLGFLNDMTMGKTIRHETEGVSLLTIHQSKGLEFQTVFVVGLMEGVLPDYRATNSVDKLKEEENNAYVAFSRAKKNCFLSSVYMRMMPWGKIKIQVESRYIKKVKVLLENK